MRNDGNTDGIAIVLWCMLAPWHPIFVACIYWSAATNWSNFRSFPFLFWLCKIKNIRERPWIRMPAKGNHQKPWFAFTCSCNEHYWTIWYTLCIIYNYKLTHPLLYPLPSGHTAPGWLITSATWRGKRNIGIRAAQFRYKGWQVMTSHDESWLVWSPEVARNICCVSVNLYSHSLSESFRFACSDLNWNRRRCCWGKENHINFHSRTSQRLTFRTPDMTWKTKILKCTWVLWISGCGAWKSIWSMPVLQGPWGWFLVAFDRPFNRRHFVLSNGSATLGKKTQPTP